MKLINKVNIFFILILCFIALLLGLFYLSPFLFEKNYPPPDTPEWMELQKSFDEKGYLTDGDIKKLNKLGDEELQKLKRSD